MHSTTTPLEREILTHFYVSRTPFPRDTLLIRQTINRFVGRGLLRWDPINDGIMSNPAALQPYMDALAAVPLPVQRWAVPVPANAPCDPSNVDAEVGR